MTRTLLACFAHPDDESFSGGVLAKYSSEGAAVHLICTTLGEQGEIADPALASPETLGEVRRGELEASAAILGVSELEILAYRDSGMAGTDPNNHPRAYIQAPAEEVVLRLVMSIRRLKPNVVFTFDAGGAYGHPDHIAIHHHTVAAVKAAGDNGLYPSAGALWTPDRLFFTAIRRSALLDMLVKLKAMGADTGDFDRPDMPIPGQLDEEIDITIDVSKVLEVKLRSMKAHKTQFGPNNPFNKFPKEIVDQFMSTEELTLGWGEPIPDSPRDDLFVGL